jgi:hypothetical protein
MYTSHINHFKPVQISILIITLMSFQIYFSSTKIMTTNQLQNNLGILYLVSWEFLQISIMICHCRNDIVSRTYEVVCRIYEVLSCSFAVVCRYSEVICRYYKVICRYYQVICRCLQWSVARRYI